MDLSRHVSRPPLIVHASPSALARHRGEGIARRGGPVMPRRGGFGNSFVRARTVIVLRCHVHRRRRSSQFLQPAASARWRDASSAAASASALTDLHGLRVLGIGYATPYLGLFREEAERCLAFMPAAQGAVKWPTSRRRVSRRWSMNWRMPLPDSAVDRVLLVHALEMAHDPTALLREVWRVLASGGRLLVVVPEPARRLGADGHHAVRSWPALFALADHAAHARDLVHADRLG